VLTSEGASPSVLTSGGEAEACWRSVAEPERTKGPAFTEG
jgi:hypothetical protein